MPVAAKEFPMKNMSINVLAAVCFAVVGLVGTAWAEDCIVTFNANGGSTVKSKTCDEFKNLTELPTSTKLANNFDGWYTHISGGTKVTISTTFEENTTIYAQWKLIAYTIDYEYNGGTATNEASYNIESPDIRLNNPTKTGYAFIGWTCTCHNEQSSTCTEYSEPLLSVTIPTGSMGYRKYTANWKLTYTVSFDLNGGSGVDTPSSVSIAAGETIPIKPSITGVAKEGYLNDGEWYTRGASSTYGITIIMRDSDSDGWNGSAALKISINGTLHNTVKIPSQTANAAGGTNNYTFNVISGDVVTFNWVKGLNDYDDECAFAVYYTDNPPSPAFDPSSGSANDDTRILLSKLYNTLSSVSDEALLGSFTAPDYEYTKFIFGTGGTPINSNTTLYLKWIKPHTVTFKSNYEGGPAETTVKTDASGKVTLPTPLERPLYTLIGWFDTPAEEGGNEITASTIFSSDKIVYARWKRNPIVRFSLNGGSGDTPPPIDVKYGASPTAEQKPSTAGFTKNGNPSDGEWYLRTGVEATSPPFEETTFENGTNGWVFVNGTQKNKWIRSSSAQAHGGSSYSVYISKNGSGNLYDTAETSIVHIYKDITFPESNSDFTLTFYFKGAAGEVNDAMTVWYSETDSTPIAGSQFESGTQIGEDYYYDTPTWTQKTITLPNGTFSGKTMRLVFTWKNDSFNHPDVNAQFPAAIDDITITVPQYFSYNKFIFGENGTIVTSDTTLYLQWVPAYTITFNPNGGSVYPLFALTVGGVIVSDLPEPTRKGYGFVGWFTAAKDGVEITASTVFTSDSTIYAQWLDKTPILPQIAIRNQIVQTKNGISLVAKTDAVIEVYNLGGKLISKQSYIAGNHNISLNHLPKGLYIVKARFGSATTEENLRLVIR